MFQIGLVFIFSAIPVIFWFFFYFKKRFIPFQLISFTFLKGLAISIVAYYIEIQLISYFFPKFWGFFLKFTLPSSLKEFFFLCLFIFFVIATIEESLKFIILKDGISNYRQINQIIDGIQLGIILGLGFATGENIFKFYKIVSLPEYFSTATIIFFLRFFISTLAHIIYSGVMGYYLVLGRFHKLYNKFLLKKAIFLPIIIHGIFNLFLLVGIPYVSVTVLLILTFIFYKWYRDRRIFEIRLHIKEIPLSPPFLSEKQETDVYLSKEKATFDFIKKIGVSRFGYQSKSKKVKK